MYLVSVETVSEEYIGNIIDTHMLFLLMRCASIEIPRELLKIKTNQHEQYKTHKRKKKKILFEHLKNK